MAQHFRKKPLSDNYLLIAAIDLGTSYSGFAYANRRKIDATIDIIHKKCWNNTSKNLDNMKTRTCVLFKLDGTFVAYGFTALKMYIDLQKEASHREYMLFRDYKIHLYDHDDSKQPLNSLKLQDMRGNRLLAKTVFTESIKAIKDQLLKSIATAGRSATEHEIRWVLTVPAIWRDDAKQFMRQCAEKAGIPSDHLILALEPEAASIYCQHLEIQRSTVQGGGFTVSKPGTKYIVVDIGGGTTDITLHIKKDNNELEEIAPAHGKNIGGKTIDSAFMDMFKDVMDTRLVRLLEFNKLDAYLDLSRNVEDMKKSITPETTGRICVRIPYQCLSNLMGIMPSLRSLTLERLVTKRSRPGMNAQLRDDNIFVNANYVISIFKETVKPVFDILSETIESNEHNGEISLIILAGGLAENELLQEMMKQRFSSKKIIVAEPASLAVLRGAVLFGCNPHIINPRKTRYTYGFGTCKYFSESEHDIKRRIFSDYDGPLCNGIFDVIIKRNESVMLDDVRQKSYATVQKQQRFMSLKLYSSETADPLYYDEPGCKEIGDYSIQIQLPTDDIRSFTVECTFYDTELKINIIDELYQTTTAAQFMLP